MRLLARSIDGGGAAAGAMFRSMSAGPVHATDSRPAALPWPTFLRGRRTGGTVPSDVRLRGWTSFSNRRRHRGLAQQFDITRPSTTANALQADATTRAGARSEPAAAGRAGDRRERPGPTPCRPPGRTHFDDKAKTDWSFLCRNGRCLWVVVVPAVLGGAERGGGLRRGSAGVARHERWLGWLATILRSSGVEVGVFFHNCLKETVHLRKICIF